MVFNVDGVARGEGGGTVKRNVEALYFALVVVVLLIGTEQSTVTVVGTCYDDVTSLLSAAVVYDMVMLG